MKTFSNIPKESELKIAVSCPVCNSQNILLYRNHELYSFQRCVDCKHIYQNPMPSKDDLANRYDNNYKDYEVENAENFLDLMLLGLKDLDFYELESNITQLKSFLDIGCATGALVEYMKNRNWESFGLDICRESAEYGKLHRKIEIFNCTLDEIPLENNSIDVIHSSHVIEHVPSPSNFINSIYRLLKPNGYCITVTPNVKSLQEKIFKEKWRSAIADHVNLFSINGLIKLHENAGLKPVKWVTWGGLAAGTSPIWLKRIVDRFIKKTSWGDVVALLSQKI